MRQGFITEVKAIESEIEAGLGKAARALSGLDGVIRNPAAARADGVSQTGQELRRRTRGLDGRLLRLSATQAPVACDLRLVLTMMALVQHGGLIANQFVLIGEQLAAIDPGVSDRCGTGRQAGELAGLAAEQLGRAVEAFARRDCDVAESLARSDDRLDRLNRDICRASLEMQAGTEQRELAFRHVLIARSLERIGDNAVNIARHTAEMVRADVHHLTHPNPAPGLSVPG
jgi:phosphate transport system protein